MQNATGLGSLGYLTAAADSCHGDTSFAGMLAALASPQTPDDLWNDDRLEDDVANINYERAQPGTTVSDHPSRVAGSETDTRDPGSRKAQSAAAPKPLKTASITIRLSQSECTQLHRRAAEAGLTVSAYLRSCTLEVEALRAQVKQALADLRNSAAHPPNPPTPAPSATGRPREIRPVLTRPLKWLQRLIQ